MVHESITFPGYEIIEEIGVKANDLRKGGMARVFRVICQKNGGERAVKLLRAKHRENPDVVAAFKREAEITACCQGENVIRYFESGENAYGPYHVFEWIEGGNLLELKQKHGNSFSHKQVMSCFKQVLTALQTVHRSGVIHCDVRPQNFMMTPKGRVVLLDFGIARYEREKFQTAGIVAGGKLFMSPEHLAPEKLCQQSDIYSAAIVLFFLLTGHTPFENKDAADNSAEAMWRVHINKAPRSPRQWDSSIPVTVEQAIFKALAKNPGNRYASVDDFLAVISRLKVSGKKGSGKTLANSDDGFPLFWLVGLGGGATILVFGLMGVLIYLVVMTPPDSGEDLFKDFHTRILAIKDNQGLTQISHSIDSESRLASGEKRQLTSLIGEREQMIIEANDCFETLERLISRAEASQEEIFEGLTAAKRYKENYPLFFREFERLEKRIIKKGQETGRGNPPNAGGHLDPVIVERIQGASKEELDDLLPDLDSAYDIYVQQRYQRLTNIAVVYNKYKREFEEHLNAGELAQAEQALASLRQHAERSDLIDDLERYLFELGEKRRRQQAEERAATLVTSIRDKIEHDQLPAAETLLVELRTHQVAHSLPIEGKISELESLLTATRVLQDVLELKTSINQKVSEALEKAEDDEFEAGKTALSAAENALDRLNGLLREYAVDAAGMVDVTALKTNLQDAEQNIKAMEAAWVLSRMPGTPTGLTASDGVSTGKVYLTWSAAANADYYQISRSVPGKVVSGRVRGTSWDDGDAAPGVEYSYWVRAVNAEGHSAYSEPDTGYRKLSPPNGISASKDHTDRISITWNVVPGATRYELYRATRDSFGSARPIATPADASYVDRAVTAGESYYYWVKAAKSGQVSSGESQSVKGLIRQDVKIDISASKRNKWDRPIPP
ncbi:MAG: protein kinase [Lentisphaeria bacterium]|nr:protein kinase [Lentisphaeria bacterium]